MGLRFLSLLVAPLLLVVAGCGGGSSEEQAVVDLSTIPTATLPNPLPEPTILGETRAPVEGANYTVAPGDTLDGIAARFGTTVEAILEANSVVDASELQVGQVLIIPGVTSAVPEEEVLQATVEPTSPETPTPGTTYTVQAGDNSSDIADSFGVTLDELAAANNTTIDDLRSLEVGDVLVIPAASGAPTP